MILTLLLSIDEFSITNVDISNIKFDKTNPNQLVKEQIDALSKGMKKFGYLSPVILNKDMVVLDGEHRVKVYEKLGKKKIPAYVINVSKLDGKMLRQVMNKLHGEHDKTKDADEFKLIFDGGKLDMFSKLIAQPKEEFEHILEQKFNIEFKRPEDEIPEPPKKPKAKLGDIYQLGNHRIMCGDSTKDLDKLLMKINIDLLLTDPPYGINLDTDWTDMESNLKFFGDKGKIRGNRYDRVIGDNKEFNPDFLIKLNIKETFLWGGDYLMQHFPRILQGGSLLVWDKRLNESFDKGFGSAFEICWSKKKHKREILRVKWFGLFGMENQDNKKRIHPTQKPLQIFTWIIDKYSKENDTVLDCYLGSGSTLIACEQTQRICYGMEIDPYYVDVVIQRWENYTHKKAVKIK